MYKHKNISMQKLFNYFSNKINFYFESILDDSYKINDFFILKKLVDKNELKKILEQNLDLSLFSGVQFEVFKKYRKNLLDKTLKNFNLKEKQYIYLFKPNKTLSEKKVIVVQSKDDKISYVNESSYDEVEKGIVFLKYKRKSSKTKIFNNLDDLKNKLDQDQKENINNIGIYISEKNNKIKIICYDYSGFDPFYNGDEHFIFPILFEGQVSNSIDSKNSKFKKIPYDGGIINWTLSRPDVSGRNILYPILAYFANNNILISDRDELSKGSKSVWSDMFKRWDIFDKKMPIDNWEKPITDTVKDDGRLFIDANNPQLSYDPSKFEDMSIEQQKKELIKIRINDPYNWAYKLSDNIKNKLNGILKTLKENHQKIVKKEGPSFTVKLETLSNDFFDKKMT